MQPAAPTASQPRVWAKLVPSRKGRLNHSTGAKGCLMRAAVGNGRVMMCHEVRGVWCGATVKALYTGSVKAAVRRSYPRMHSRKVLDCNDPTGCTSTAGKAVKRASNLASGFTCRRVLHAEGLSELRNKNCRYTTQYQCVLSCSYDHITHQVSNSTVLIVPLHFGTLYDTNHAGVIRTA